MRYHMLPKSYTSKEGCTEIVDVVGIDTGVPACGRQVHITKGDLELYEIQIEKSAEVIVVRCNEPITDILEVSQTDEGLNAESCLDSIRIPELSG